MLFALFLARVLFLVYETLLLSLFFKCKSFLSHAFSLSRTLIHVLVLSLALLQPGEHLAVSLLLYGTCPHQLFHIS